MNPMPSHVASYSSRRTTTVTTTVTSSFRNLFATTVLLSLLVLGSLQQQQQQQQAHLWLFPTTTASMTVSAFSITAVRRHLLNHGRTQGSSSSSSACFVRINNTNGRYARARILATRLWDTPLGSDDNNDNNLNGAEEEEEEAIPGSGAIPTGLLSNQQLVQQRLAVQRGKAEARDRTIQARVDKNYRLKRLFHTDAASSSAAAAGSSSLSTNDTSESLENARHSPPMYAVKVWVEPNFRQELKLSGREKRGRVFFEEGSLGVSTLAGLRQELHGFFAALRKDTYLVRASLPRLASDGSWQSPDATTEEEDGAAVDEESSWPIETDGDVIQTFQAADTFFQKVNAVSALASSSSSSSSSTDALKRPSIQISILKNPNAPIPPPPPSYLQDLPDPNASPTMTMLSFYAFPPHGIADPEGFGMDLSKKWKPFRTVGRVYVAQEGINAQMSVPTNVLQNFMDCCRSVPELAYMENGINIDPKALSTVEFATAGVPVNGQPAPPFRNLHIRVRNQVLADGLWNDADALSSVPSLDWQSAGYDMSPLEWHQKLKEAKEIRERMALAETGSSPMDSLPIILDCRNKYESDVGIFEGAEPLDTDSFRDSWPVLKKRLADAPKDTPILTYCTGGIRCVKVGAYLTQELGFTNVSRLAGGIIAYDRTLSEQAQEEKPLFKGTNFVFDGRLGRPITEDAMGVCGTCGNETSAVSNCLNDSCNIRMIQCETCKTSYHGTCSTACKHRVVLGGRGRMVPPPIPTPNGDPSVIPPKRKTRKFDSIQDYCVGHSSSVPSFYQEIEFNTRAYLPSGAHMVSGAEQGRLLTQLASMTREGRILELGTFTGYATACFVEGAANAGRAIGATTGNAQGGPYVMTMERDVRAVNLASAHLGILAQYGLEDDTEPKRTEAMRALRKNDGNNSDNDNKNITVMDQDVLSFSLLNGIVGCDIVRVTDALATVEEIAMGGSSGAGPEQQQEQRQQPAPFDLVFVDADKTRLLEYVEACLRNDNVLKPGGYIVVDNVLWKGLVLEASAGDFSSSSSDLENEDPNSSRSSRSEEELRKNRRARRLATQMHAFNSAIVQDKRVEVLLLPMRDGLSVIRKR